MGEVKPVAQRNQSQGDDVMQDELLEIFPGLFQEQDEHNGLLGPVAGLEEVVGLVDAFKCSMREAFEHGSGIEVPKRALRHDIQPKGTKAGKVDCGIDLLHESHLLCLGRDAAPYGPRPNDSLHDELASEAEDNNVEADKSDIELALVVHVGSPGIVRTERIGEEDGMMKGIVRSGVDIVC